jgi:hypothetical protein
MVYNQLDSIESHCRSAKAITCWLEYVHNRLHQGVINKRYELKFQISTLRSALLYWKDYALSKATLRRRLRIFRQLHPPRSGSTSDISCVRRAFLVWSQDFVQSRRRDGYLSDMLRILTRRCKTKWYLELWENEWSRKLERRLSLYRVLVRLDAVVATAHYLRQFIRNGLNLPEERKHRKTIYQKRILSGISSSTEGVISSSKVCVSPPGYEMSIAGRRTLHHFLEIAYVQGRGLRILFRRWLRLTAAYKVQMSKSQEEALFDMQSIDRMGSGVQSVDTMGPDAHSIDSMGSDERSIDRMGSDVQNMDRMDSDVQNMDRMDSDVQNKDRMGSDVQNIDRMDSDVQNIDRMDSDAQNIDRIDSDVQNIDRMGSDVQSIDRMGSIADAFVAARLTRLVRNCLSVWAGVTSSRRRSLRRLSVRCIAKDPFRHWMLLLREIAVRRLRDAPIQDASFFSKTVAIASSEIMRKDLRQMELRTLKAKRLINLKSSTTKGIDGFSSLKKRCSTGKSGDCVRERADTSRSTSTLDSARSKKNRSSSGYTTVDHTTPITVPDFPTMSSASIKTLWGSVVIDDCSKSTYLGQHAKKKIIKN